MKREKKLPKYIPGEIETKWQQSWSQNGLYLFDRDSSKEPYYTLVELPYPSGDLHLGHWFTFVPPDAHARYMRMSGKNTFFPNGFDAFGLPAENAAIKRDIHPQDWTLKNIETMKTQLATMGTMIDWSHEAITCLPEYYKWNQWIFQRMFERGIAYRGKVLSNWCPVDQTVLANEHVEDGKCWRCGNTVEQKEVEQWFLKITEYADELLWDNVDQKTSNGVNWPRSVREGQNNWIGRSNGAQLSFPIKLNAHIVILHGFEGNSREGFYPWLKQSLEEKGYRVSLFDLPNTTHPTEEEQVQFVLNHCRFDDETILYGHSLGSIVAMKVLEKLEKPIAGLVLSGTFNEPIFKDRSRPFEKTFGFEFEAEKIRQNAGFIRVLHDINDTAVSQDQAQKVADMLGVTLEAVEAEAPHFGGTEEPELLSAIVPSIQVFTTRPDTLYGATFLVVAPEHELVAKLLAESGIKNHESSKVNEYVKQAKQKTERERKEQKEKTGVFTDLYAIHPLSGKEIPIWVADYVLRGYGTGAIMAVPAHDERDYEFAKKFGLPIKQVIKPLESKITNPSSSAGRQESRDKEHDSEFMIHNLGENLPYSGPGTIINSEGWSGWHTPNDIARVFASIEKSRIGRKTVTFHLHDWSVSRQRYWGTPVPMIHCESCGIVPVPEADLPVILPYEVDYTPKGKPPLASAEEWMKVKCPECGKEAVRDTETLDTFFDSSWYYYRYLDPKYEQGPFDPALAKTLMPLDIYFGGAEHTLGHTLYARFFTKFFKDLGMISFDEFAKKRVQHGVILGPDGNRMSKSRGNVVNPDNVVAEYGADTVRVYLCFMMPYEDTVAPWNPKAIAGIYRFLRRIWDLYEKVDSDISSDIDKESLHQMHKTIKKVGEDLGNIKFNTAIASLMEWLNFLSAKPSVSQEEYHTLLLLLAPFAPHISEELWQSLQSTKSSTVTTGITGDKKTRDTLDTRGTFVSIHLQSWPKYDEAYLSSETVTIAVQVNGKLRGSFDAASELIHDQSAIESKAKAIENISKNLDGKRIMKVIYIKGKILNFVVND